MMAGTSGELRSAADWDEYFGEGGGWERNGGREQSRLFAEQFCRRTSLPKDEPLSLLDYGCALGDSLPVIRRAFPHSPGLTAVKRMIWVASPGLTRNPSDVSALPSWMARTM